MHLPFQLPQLTPTEWSMISAFAYKVFSEAADSLPPIAETSGYWKTFWYNFIQRLASNGSKLIVRKP